MTEKANAVRKQQTFPEYLGDITGIDVHDMLNGLTNVNQFVDSISAVPAELDYTVVYLKTRDGKFAGLVIRPSNENAFLEVEKVSYDKTEASA